MKGNLKKLWQIFACLLEENPAEQDYISQAIHCMKLEYADGITVAEIAKRLNLNRSYFSVLFKERTGQTPQDYLTALRMEKAIELMEETLRRKSDLVQAKNVLKKLRRKL